MSKDGRWLAAYMPSSCRGLDPLAQRHDDIRTETKWCPACTEEAERKHDRNPAIVPLTRRINSPYSIQTDLTASTAGNLCMSR